MTRKTTKSYDDTAAAAQQIIDAAKLKEAAKTARLREARLAKEMADLLAHAPGKTRAAAKAKGKR